MSRRKRQAPSTDIGAGDLLIALRDGKRSPNGFPCVVPKKGRLYRCAGVYEMWYGFGCTLEELSPKPYRGFFLIAHGVQYFRKVEIDEQEADESFIQLLRVGIGGANRVGVGTPARQLEFEDG